MKLTVYRQSGSPVDMESQKQYDEEFKVVFDLVEQRSMKTFQKPNGVLNKRLVPHMIIFQRMLRFAERSLMRKYATDVQVEFPKSAKQMTALINSYGETPIMFAKDSHGNLVVIVMDALNG